MADGVASDERMNTVDDIELAEQIVELAVVFVRHHELHGVDDLRDKRVNLNGLLLIWGTGRHEPLIDGVESGVVLALQTHDA